MWWKQVSIKMITYFSLSKINEYDMMEYWQFIYLKKLYIINTAEYMKEKRNNQSEKFFSISLSLPQIC